jgi:hypothetical protein
MWVSLACHHPDFDLAKRSHQAVDSAIFVQMIFEEIRSKGVTVII